MPQNFFFFWILIVTKELTFLILRGSPIAMPNNVEISISAAHFHMYFPNQLGLKFKELYQKAMLLFQLSSNPDMMRNLLKSSIALLTLPSFLARDRAVPSASWERFTPSLLQVKTLCAAPLYLSST